MKRGRRGGGSMDAHRHRASGMLPFSPPAAVLYLLCAIAIIKSSHML